MINTPVVYKRSCPVCGEELTLDEITRGMCRTGYPLTKPFHMDVEYEFAQFFEERLGLSISPLQRMWVRRLGRGESFTAVAPTGVGKTLFGLAYSAFLAEKGKRIYVIVPTTLLLQQSVDRLREIMGVNGEVVFFHGRMRKKEKEGALSRISSGDFRILLTTSAFLSKHFDIIEDKIFDFIFVDDVDSILKASKNVDRILILLGLDNDEHGILMVSTATSRLGAKAPLLRRLLGFGIGSPSSITNVEHYSIVKTNGDAEVITERMGYGGLVFTQTEEEALRIAERLGDRCGLVISSRGRRVDELIESFLNREIDVLVGVCAPYGLLVRGLDYPLNIRYVVFMGAPMFNLGKEGSEKFIQSLKTTKSLPKDVLLRDGCVLIPNIRTYLQAVGRTSRLMGSGMTKGISFVIDEAEVLDVFERRARFHDVEFVRKRVDEIEYERLRRELEESRKESLFTKPLIRPALFVVESPTKAKQIARFFGRPSAIFREGLMIYEVAVPGYVLLITSTMGHITDLSEKEGWHGVKIENGRFVPVYGPIRKCPNDGEQFVDYDVCPKCGSTLLDALPRIISLMEIAYDCGFVITATDPDTEGEKIAWDVMRHISPFAQVKRAEFHEVTRRAVLKAVENMRDVNELRTRAQMVRRIEDRWIGFELSSLLQRRFKMRNLSTGRAQGPVLSWIIDRFFEHRKKVVDVYIVIEHPQEEWTLAFDSYSLDSQECEVILEEEVEEVVHPLPPYTTDTILHDINRTLRIGASEGMKILQDLFRKGVITYPRTDSTHVSDRGLEIAKEYLQDYFVPRRWGEEGAHECIRPTRPIDPNTLRRMVREMGIEGLTRNHYKVYSLIFGRFMASEAIPAHVVKGVYKIRVDGRELRAERILRVDWKVSELELRPRMRGQPYIQPGRYPVRIKKRTRPAVELYTQADMISLMKRRGIGRPSTYATIIKRLFDRGYIIEKRGRLIPTKKGITIAKFLMSRFSSLVSEERTKIVEQLMDDVEQGKAEYHSVLSELYKEIREITQHEGVAHDKGEVPAKADGGDNTRKG